MGGNCNVILAENVKNYKNPVLSNAFSTTGLQVDFHM